MFIDLGFKEDGAQITIAAAAVSHEADYSGNGYCRGTQNSTAEAVGVQPPPAGAGATRSRACYQDSTSTESPPLTRSILIKERSDGSAAVSSAVNRTLEPVQ